jgi:hypothetical protein
MRLLLLSANPGRVAATDTLPLLDHELIVQSKEQIKVNLTPNNGAPVKGIVICYGYRIRMWRMITPWVATASLLALWCGKGTEHLFRGCVAWLREGPM